MSKEGYKQAQLRHQSEPAQMNLNWADAALSNFVKINMSRKEFKKLLESSGVTAVDVSKAMGRGSNYLTSKFSYADLTGGKPVRVTHEDFLVIANSLKKEDRHKLEMVSSRKPSLNPRGSSFTLIGRANTEKQIIPDASLRQIAKNIGLDVINRPVGTASVRRAVAISRAKKLIEHLGGHAVPYHSISRAFGVIYSSIPKAIESGKLTGHRVVNKMHWVVVIDEKLISFLNGYRFQSSDGFNERGAYKNKRKVGTARIGRAPTQKGRGKKVRKYKERVGKPVGQIVPSGTAELEGAATALQEASESLNALKKHDVSWNLSATGLMVSMQLLTLILSIAILSMLVISASL